MLWPHNRTSAIKTIICPESDPRRLVSVYKTFLMEGEKVTVKLNEIIEKAKNNDVAIFIVCAIKKLFERDRHLLKVNANERSITHRLAIYLQENFWDWDVDCEYNRNGHEVKRVRDDIGCVASDDTECRTIFPDIIVHRRSSDGRTDENILVVEIKKTTSYQPNDIDLTKLRCLSEQLKYKNALFLRLITGLEEIGVAEFCWVYPNQMENWVN